MRMKEEQFCLIKAQIKKLMGQGGFYSKKFAGIDPAFPAKPGGFRKAALYLEGRSAGCLSAGAAGGIPDEEVVRIHSSSGTTGTPVIIPYTKKDVDDWALMFKRCYEMAGVTARDRIQMTPG